MPPNTGGAAWARAPCGLCCVTKSTHTGQGPPSPPQVADVPQVSLSQPASRGPAPSHFLLGTCAHHCLLPQLPFLSSSPSSPSQTEGAGAEEAPGLAGCGSFLKWCMRKDLLGSPPGTGDGASRLMVHLSWTLSAPSEGPGACSCSLSLSWGSSGIRCPDPGDGRGNRDSEPSVATGPSPRCDPRA